MIIALGSTNIVKVSALEEVIKEYPLLSHAEVKPCAVSSEIANQPLSLEEIIRGAKNRAKNAYSSSETCAYSFGVESGLFEAPGTQTGFLESCICAIYDGRHYYTGLSCGFEIPSHILEFVLTEQLDLSQACQRAKVSTNANLGAAEGLIGILTKGRIDRKEYTKQSIKTALIQLENAHWYSLETSTP